MRVKCELRESLAVSRECWPIGPEHKGWRADVQYSRIEWTAGLKACP